MGKKLLIENIKAQAKYYLENVGEFYPFGACIDKQESIKPISVYISDEFPTSERVFLELEKAVKKQIANGDYLEAAIGIDINLDQNGSNTSALRIKIYNDKNQESQEDIPYTLSSEKNVQFK